MAMSKAFCFTTVLIALTVSSCNQSSPVRCPIDGLPAQV